MPSTDLSHCLLLTTPCAQVQNTCLVQALIAELAPDNVATAGGVCVRDVRSKHDARTAQRSRMHFNLRVKHLATVFMAAAFHVEYGFVSGVHMYLVRACEFGQFWILVHPELSQHTHIAHL